MDVVIVGGGLAGWTGAVAALEAGAQVTLVERGETAPGWSNSMISGGALHAVLRDPRTDPATLAAAITELTGGACVPEVVNAWATNAARTIAWIEAHGGNLSSDPTMSHRAKVFEPVKPTVPGTAHRGFGTTNFLETLHRRFTAAGGTVLFGAQAKALAREDKGWRLTLADGRSLTARAVVLADGGFQANAALMRRYVGTDKIRLRAADTSVGDGLSMGLANGGVAVNMNGFYGHLLARAALTRDDLWPYPMLDGVAAVGILVGRDGRRFTDENLGGVRSTNAVAWSADPLGCWLIVDDAGWNAEGQIGVTPPNPYLLDHDAGVISAPLLEELAAQAGIDPDGVAATVAALDDQPVPPRGGTVKMRVPPFHAIPLVAGVTFTLGGLKINGHARVVDAGNRPIDDLYAAGGTAGGLHGGPDAGYAGGLLEAAVFGLIAGESAAGAGKAATPIDDGGDS
jgi:fumarate reductase flavoprotein subunit